MGKLQSCSKDEEPDFSLSSEGTLDIIQRVVAIVAVSVFDFETTVSVDLYLYGI